MIKRIFLGVAVCLVLWPGLVSADAKKSKLPDDRTLVSAIDLNKHTIDLTHESHGIKTTYAVAPDITVVIHGKPSAVKDLKIGMSVKQIQLGSGMDDPPILEEIDIEK